MAELIQIKPSDNLDAEPSTTTREALDKVWAAKGFIEVGADGQPQKPLDDRTVAELHAYAEVHGIDLLGQTKKADILAAIRAGEPTQEV